jgi:hypothetical protein
MNHVFEMVSIIGRIYNGRAGLYRRSRWSFFEPGGFGYGPEGSLPTRSAAVGSLRIVADRPAGRGTTTRAATWRSRRRATRRRLERVLPATPGRPRNQTLPDYAGIGVTNDKFTVSSNVFDIDQPFYFVCTMIVLEKADVLAGLRRKRRAIPVPLNLNRFTVRPAVAFFNERPVPDHAYTGTTLTAIAGSQERWMRGT